MARTLLQLSFLWWLLCASATATAQGAQDEDELVMVYIGASWMQRAAFLYSGHVAEDLGVAVRFWQRNSGGNVSIATAKLAAGGQWDIVDDADIVVVMLTGNFGSRVGYCLDTPSVDPFSESPEELRADVEEFFAELVRHVDPAQTIVRIGLPAVKPHFRSQWVERDVLAECGEAWSQLLDQWRDVAGDYGALVVDVTAAWNGSGATVASPIEYFRRDQVHLNEQGSELVADLLRAAGYSPRAP